MKTYGKEPESLESIVSVFLSDLAEYPAKEIMQAIKLHSQRSPEFPTVFDIVQLIKRRGLPPLTESMYIAISRKPCDQRTGEDWNYIRDYEAERDAGWDDATADPQKLDGVTQENARLRQQVKDQQARIEQLEAQLRDKFLPPPREAFTPEDRLRRTVEMMRGIGTPEETIQELVSTETGKIAQHG